MTATTTAPTGRAGMVTLGNLYGAHASQFAYSEEPDRAEIFDLTYSELDSRLMSGETITGDCSSTWEATCKDVGIPLGPLGYTGTELEKMPHIELKDGQLGDGIVFGAYPGKHVVWIAETDPTNPLTYGHGEPGFTKIRLLDLWDSTFPGDPITVLSLAPFIPDPYHYVYYDSTVVRDIPHPSADESDNTERWWVECYDVLRPSPQKNAKALVPVIENLIEFAQRIENDERADHDPKGLKDHRSFRHKWIVARISGEQVTS